MQVWPHNSRRRGRFQSSYSNGNATSWAHLELPPKRLGGFIGSVGRYKLGSLVLHHTGDWRFPLSTFLVSIAGCFVIGLLTGLATRQHIFSPDVRLFLLPGLLGGFTTFSAFGYETFFLMRKGESHIALSYVALSVLCGLALVWLGFKLTVKAGP